MASSSFAASSSKTRMNSLADDLALASRGRPDPASLARKRSSASTWTSGMPNCSKACDHLLGLVHPHQAVVDEDAGQLLADRLVDEQRRDRGVDAAGEPADHPALAHLRLDPRHLLGDHRLRRPLLLAAGDVAQEAGEDLGPVGGVDDLGVELDPVEAAVGRLAGGDRRARARGERGEALAAARRPRRGGSSSSSAPPAGRRAAGRRRRGGSISVRPNSPASAPSTLPPSAWTIACIP